MPAGGVEFGFRRAGVGKRDFLRVSPSIDAPVGISFSPEELNEMVSFVKVRNISAGGVMIQISDAAPGRDGLLPTGYIIKRIQLSLPGQDACVLAGIVRFTYGSLRGIEFLPNEQEQGKLARYVYQREVEMLGHPRRDR
ncbi:MAG: PilZ domain-containing protein [Nitrospiraceae bacterium]|nr:PilZ domain-containing protein [Nitrospiraceae bacterium]